MTARVALVVLAGLLGYAVHALAQPRIDVRPTMMPVPSSASSTVSFAWFYDATTRTVVVCRAGANAADGPDCRSQTTLP
ncbi:MAG: hypothetical protein M3Z31_05995 [Pseudomonadota bacterium]|nr:hypothetical protein [Pseudomonadota bacterium]